MSTEKLAAKVKAEELAKKYGGVVIELGEFGYGIETDEATMRTAARELALFVEIDEGTGSAFSASEEYPDAGEEGQIFADRGGFQSSTGCIIGVSYTCL